MASAASRGGLAVTVRGRGNPVLLVHGVAYGPATLLATAEILARSGVRAIIVHRRGYGDSRGLAPATDLRRHADDLVDVLDDAGVGRAVWVGVSGGATITLAGAIHHPERMAGAVLHEPAIGHLAPGLQRMLATAAGRVVAAATAEAGAVGLARSLVGLRAWQSLAPGVRAGVRAAAATVRREVALFPAYAPLAVEVAALRRLRLVSSVGSHSDAARREVTGVLERLAGARGVTTRSGHLAQIDAPSALASLALGLAEGAA